MMMSPSMPMNAADASELSRCDGNGGGAMAGSRSSMRVNRGLRRPASAPLPRPAPKIYRIEANDFRAVVQELTTGSSSSENSGAANKPAGNSRLRKIAPPPIQPLSTFSFPKFGEAAPQQFNSAMSPLFSPNNGKKFNDRFGPALSPLTQWIDPFSSIPSPQQFSPLPALSPTDQLWTANQLSPNCTALLHHLAASQTSQASQSIAESVGSGRGGADQFMESRDQFLERSSDHGGSVYPERVDTRSNELSPATNWVPESPSNISLSPRCNWATLTSPTMISMASALGVGNFFQMDSPTSGLTGCF